MEKLLESPSFFSHFSVVLSPSHPDYWGTAHMYTYYTYAIGYYYCNFLCESRQFLVNGMTLSTEFNKSHIWQKKRVSVWGNNLVFRRCYDSTPSEQTSELTLTAQLASMVRAHTRCGVRCHFLPLYYILVWSLSLSGVKKEKVYFSFTVENSCGPVSLFGF